MQIDLDSSLERWVKVALLDGEQAGRIRDFENARSPRRTARAPILIGLALGGIMLASGVLLFVAAHWSNLSPTERMTLLIAAVGVLHLGGAFVASRFSALSVMLHAVGTAALGGAIFLAAQIFNLQEHWPTGILLWAIGALAGWCLLRSWPQLGLAALLVPCWLIGEWVERAPQAAQMHPVVLVFCALLATCYLSLPAPTFTWIGGIGLIPSIVAVATGTRWGSTPASTGRFLIVGWSIAFLLPLALAFIYRKRRVWMNLAAALWVATLSGLAWYHVAVWIYLWCAIGSAGMIAWGIYEFRSERINLGMAGFALTVLFFYFSSVMDMLGRSTSLITLGVVFLAGAWYWEKLRRKLVARIQSAGGVA
jgi:uncharacterized membrane protein